MTPDRYAHLPGMRRPLVIADYDSRWPAMFEEERRRLEAALGPLLDAVEHVGSTAVPGLGAKPVIDLMVGVRSLEDADRCVKAVESLGYTYVPDFEDVMPERRYFRRDTEGVRSHQIHMVVTGSPFWVRHLAFRDYLREHAEWRERYEALKRELAARYGEDVGGYTDAKTEFIREVEARAGV